MNEHPENIERDWRKKKRNYDGGTKTIKGILYARVQYVDATGKRREKLRPADSKSHARRLIKEMRNELETGGEETIQADRLTFQLLSDKYEKTRLTPAVILDGYKVSGLRSAKNTKVYLKPLREYFGRQFVRTIKPSDLEDYKNHRLNTPVKTTVKVKKTIIGAQGEPEEITEKHIINRPRKMASVNRELETLRAMLNFAKQESWILLSPFERKKSVISKAAELERDRTLSFEEEKRLFDACGDRVVTYNRRRKGKLEEISYLDTGDAREHLRPLLIAALDTGMRRGELFKLTWNDVYLDEGFIRLRHTTTKTEKQRDVPISNRMKAELTKLAEKREAPESLVFGITDTIKNAWKSLCKTAGVKNFRLHDCRHTATTRMIRAGIPHGEVMKITGHAQMKTFLRYLNTTPETLTSASNLISAYTANKTAQLEITESTESDN